MDDIQTRLQEASQNCLKAFLNWDGQKKDAKAQEELHAAIHELRKVSSRLEIELALSERDQMTSKPLPIPPHRSSKKVPKDNNSGPKAGGNNAPKESSGGVEIQSKPKRRRTAPKSGSEEE